MTVCNLRVPRINGLNTIVRALQIDLDRAYIGNIKISFLTCFKRALLAKTALIYLCGLKF